MAAATPIRTLLVTRIRGLEEALTSRNLKELELFRTKNDDATAETIGQAEIIIADPPLVAPLVGQAENLKWIQATSAGVEALLRDSSRTDYHLSRLKGVFGPQMAEYVLGHIIARERLLVELHLHQQQRRWQSGEHRLLAELVLGILGLGDIGLELARIAKSFGMTVWGLRRSAVPAPGVDRVFVPEHLDELLAGSDYFVNILPSTPTTRDLLSGERLRAAKPGAVFINVGRGDIIDEPSIVRAVEQRWIAGAVLDVFREEPLPDSSPLWTLPGVTITPHVAARSMVNDIVHAFEANLARYVAGEPPQHLVEWDRGY